MYKEILNMIFYHDSPFKACDLHATDGAVGGRAAAEGHGGGTVAAGVLIQTSIDRPLDADHATL